MSSDDEFKKLVPVEDSDTESEALAEMEKAIEASRDERKEERFIWVLVAIVLFDVLAFQTMPTWTAPLVIAVLELIFLLVLARLCGVQEVEQLVDRMAKWLGKD